MAENDLIANILKYIADSQYLRAKSEYDQLLSLPSSSHISEFIEINEKLLREMTERCEEVEKTLIQISAEMDDQWIWASHIFGVTTHYKMDENGKLLLRMEGDHDDIPMIEMLAVVYEIEQYTHWAPFCTESKLLSRLSKTELILHNVISPPFSYFTRDAVVHAYGVDCLYEHEAIVVVGGSISHHETVELPPYTPSYFFDRVDIQFRSVMRPTSPTSGKVTILAQVNPKLSFIPSFLLDFITRQIAGIFLVVILKQARQIASDSDSVYRDLIQENSQFYFEWVLPKLRLFIDHKGWPQPVVECLGERGIPPPPVPPLNELNTI